MLLPVHAIHSIIRLFLFVPCPMNEGFMVGCWRLQCFLRWVFTEPHWLTAQLQQGQGPKPRALSSSAGRSKHGGGQWLLKMLTIHHPVCPVFSFFQFFGPWLPPILSRLRQQSEARGKIILFNATYSNGTRFLIIQREIHSCFCVFIIHFMWANFAVSVSFVHFWPM